MNSQMKVKRLPMFSTTISFPWNFIESENPLCSTKRISLLQALFKKLIYFKPFNHSLMSIMIH